MLAAGVAGAAGMGRRPGQPALHLQRWDDEAQDDAVVPGIWQCRSDVSHEGTSDDFRVRVAA